MKDSNEKRNNPYTIKIRTISGSPLGDIPLDRVHVIINDGTNDFRLDKVHLQWEIIGSNEIPQPRTGHYPDKNEVDGKPDYVLHQKDNPTEGKTYWVEIPASKIDLSRRISENYKCCVQLINGGKEFHIALATFST